MERNRTTAGYQVVEGEPKTAAGPRAAALDKHTVTVLREHRRRQLAHRDHRRAAGKTWIDSGYLFTGKTGQPINPNYATTRFRMLTKRARPCGSRKLDRALDLALRVQSRSMPESYEHVQRTSLRT